MYQLVNSGSRSNTDNADTIRESFHKINQNFIFLSSSLNLDQVPAVSAGSPAGYALITISGSNYKIPLYNV